MADLAPLSGRKAERCHICEAPDLRPYHDQGYRRLLKCKACRVVFSDPLPTQAEAEELERLAEAGEILAESADIYTGYGRDFVEDPITRSFRSALARIATIREPGTLLDVGPGTGIFLHLAREAGWRGRGIDISPEGAARAAAEFDLEIDVGIFEESSHSAESFDCITMFDVVEHSLDPLRFLRRAHELLKPGGALYVAVPNEHSLMTAILDRYAQVGLPGSTWFLDRLYVAPHLFYFGPRVLMSTLERAGFEVADVRGEHVYLARYELPLWVRLPSELVLRVGGLLGMAGRVLALAKKPGS